MFKVNNKGTRTMPGVVNFEQANTGWESITAAFDSMCLMHPDRKR